MKNIKNKLNTGNSELYGLILIIIGAVFLLVEITSLSMLHIVSFFVILLGFFFIAKKRYISGIVLILITTGLLFRNYLTIHMPYIWAVLMILLGSFTILKKL